LGLIHRLQINCVAVMEEAQPDALAVSRDEILQEHPTLLSFIGPLCAEFFHEPTAFDSNDDGYWRTRELDFLLRALRTVRALAAIALDARVCLHGFYSSRLCSLLCINPSWGTSAGGPQGAPPPKRYATNDTCRGDFMPEYARMNGVVRVAVCARLPLPFARLRQGPRIVQRIELVDRMLAYVSFTAEPNGRT
jgi:hypothetical protein